MFLIGGIYLKKNGWFDFMIDFNSKQINTLSLHVNKSIIQ